MKKILFYRLFGLCLLLLLFSNINTYSQNYYPQLRYENGDTIPYTFPPPDSTYIHNDLIILFRPQSLYLEKLCYQFGEPEPKVKTNIVGIANSNAQIAYLLNQRFPVDSLISNPDLLYAIKAFGGDTLRRMSLANPCTDTISVGLNGDTIICHNYLWMVLHLNNDTSAVTSAISLSYLYQKQIGGASLNFIYHFAKEPSISQDSYYPLQKSLKMCGIDTAWNYQVGNPAIKVAVIDCGLDYRNCDLNDGSNPKYGPGKKVADGIYFADPTADFADHDEINHGTCVAGIIGAYTNRNHCNSASEGIAGIAGGWGPFDNNGIDQNIGCSLIGLNVFKPINQGQGSPDVSTEYAVKAFESASAKYTDSEYNFSERFVSNIINCSWGGTGFDLILQHAVNYAYQHGLSIAACSQNNGIYEIIYPACFDNNLVTNIGGSNYQKARHHGSNFSNKIDLIAPFGSHITYEDANNLIIYATYQTDSGTVLNHFDYFSGTSAATPHVTGVMALLRSDALDKGWTGLEPEDYEGMLKASALDIDSSYNKYKDDGTNDKYSVGYDSLTGWGHLQADSIFKMFNEGYRVSHYSIDTNFSSTYSMDTPVEFINDFYPSTKTWWKNYSSDTTYYVRIYKLENTIHLPANKWLVDSLHPLYVWGRSGGGGKSGLSLANPLYTSGYTRVTSGTHGNDSVDGIFHSHSFDVHVITYQYHTEDSKDHFLSTIPPDSNLAANISVFGCESKTYTSVPSEKIITDDFDAMIFPNPAIDNANLQVVLKKPSTVSYILYNSLGNRLLEYNSNSIHYGIQTYELNIKNITPGVYFTKLKINNEIKFIKLIIQGE